MARGGRGAVRQVRAKGVTGLAWASLIVAVVGGTFAAGMWIGDVVRFILDMIPWVWVPAVLLLVAVVALGLDLFLDGVPNQVAIYSGILTPSVATATDGKLGNKIGEWTGALVNWLNEALTVWLGTSSAIGLAVACIACSLLMARRVIRKSAGDGLGNRQGVTL